jgi:putative FmdB family regulatory protein
LYFKEVFVLPIYEYECLSCGERFDEMRKLSDPPVTECKLCKGTVRKLLAAPALQFKGTGWYVTDYAGKNASSHKEGAAKDGGNGSGAPKPEAKPEAKTEKKDAPSCSCPSGKCAAPSKQ